MQGKADVLFPAACPFAVFRGPLQGDARCHGGILFTFFLDVVVEECFGELPALERGPPGLPEPVQGQGEIFFQAAGVQPAGTEEIGLCEGILGPAVSAEGGPQIVSQGFPGLVRAEFVSLGIGLIQGQRQVCIRVGIEGHFPEERIMDIILLFYFFLRFLFIEDYVGNVLCCGYRFLRKRAQFPCTGIQVFVEMLFEETDGLEGSAGRRPSPPGPGEGDDLLHGQTGAFLQDGSPVVEIEVGKRQHAPQVAARGAEPEEVLGPISVSVLVCEFMLVPAGGFVVFLHRFRQPVRELFFQSESRFGSIRFIEPVFCGNQVPFRPVSEQIAIAQFVHGLVVATERSIIEPVESFLVILFKRLPAVIMPEGFLKGLLRVDKPVFVGTVPPLFPKKAPHGNVFETWFHGEVPRVFRQRLLEASFQAGFGDETAAAGGFLPPEFRPQVLVLQDFRRQETFLRMPVYGVTQIVRRNAYPPDGRIGIVPEHPVFIAGAGSGLILGFVRVIGRGDIRDIHGVVLLLRREMRLDVLPGLVGTGFPQPVFGDAPVRIHADSFEVAPAETEHRIGIAPQGGIVEQPCGPDRILGMAEKPFLH